MSMSCSEVWWPGTGICQRKRAESFHFDSAVTTALRKTCVYTANPSLERKAVPRLPRRCLREHGGTPLVTFLACAGTWAARTRAPSRSAPHVRRSSLHPQELLAQTGAGRGARSLLQQQCRAGWHIPAGGSWEDILTMTPLHSSFYIENSFIALIIISALFPHSQAAPEPGCARGGFALLV